MNIQKMEEVFEHNILPTLGKVKSKDKYLRIIAELASNTTKNGGRGIREAQITDELQPAKYVLDKLAEKGFVEITLPVGDGTLLNDPINNRRELFNKQRMIDDYFSRLKKHVVKNQRTRECVKQIIHITSDESLDEWLESLDSRFDFKEYNEVIFGLLSRGIDIKIEGYGPLLWRNLAKYYNISETTKDLLED